MRGAFLQLTTHDSQLTTGHPNLADRRKKSHPLDSLGRVAVQTAAPSPAARPVAQAQEKLYPPTGPNASSTSPQI